jgi:hypothetical protein
LVVPDDVDEPLDQVNVEADLVAAMGVL